MNILCIIYNLFSNECFTLSSFMRCGASILYSNCVIEVWVQIDPQILPQFLAKCLVTIGNPYIFETYDIFL